VKRNVPLAVGLTVPKTNTLKFAKDVVFNLNPTSGPKFRPVGRKFRTTAGTPSFIQYVDDIPVRVVRQRKGLHAQFPLGLFRKTTVDHLRSAVRRKVEPDAGFIFRVLGVLGGGYFFRVVVTGGIVIF
jgi:hypothetical protein